LRFVLQSGAAWTFVLLYVGSTEHLTPVYTRTVYRQPVLDRWPSVQNVYTVYRQPLLDGWPSVRPYSVQKCTYTPVHCTKIYLIPPYAIWYNGATGVRMYTDGTVYTGFPDLYGGTLTVCTLG